ncbi:MAG: DMT family transporter [Acidimicrobiia bacterium]|jgi:drug/metabolite transporter (DMT)-like permease
MSDTAIAIVLAVSAGFAYALASVLQQRAAAQAPPELSLRPGLLLNLVRRPTWLFGTVIDGGAYALEAASLAFGSIIIVQPLLVTGLLWALPLAAVGRPERVTRREWIPAIALVIGLATFVTVGDPHGGRAQASGLAWILTVVGLTVPVVIAVVAARNATPGRRALLLAFSAGCVYGLTAALTKSTLDLLDGGVLDVFTHWQPYALVAAGFVGFILNQSAFQAGHLAASLPAMAVTDPVVGCVIGVTLFGESLGATGTGAVAATSVAVVVMIIATVSLARSPLVTEQHEHDVDPVVAA